MYKCRPCAMVYWFYIVRPYMDMEYWNKLLEIRDNHPLYVPPVEKWAKDGMILKRLEALGYWGGDLDYGEETEMEEVNVD